MRCIWIAQVRLSRSWSNHPSHPETANGKTIKALWRHRIYTYCWKYRETNAVNSRLSLSLSCLLEYYIPCMYYIRTCTDISICPLHLGSTRPWACRALHATKVSDYKQLHLQLHFDVVAEHCYTRAVLQQTPTDKWQQLQRQGQPAHSSMTLQAYTGTNWPHHYHSSMVTTVSTRIGNTSS